MGRRSRRRGKVRRRGVVLVAVLALLTLSGALIAGAYAAARASARATRTARAEVFAQAAARRAIARAVAAWSAGDDSLRIGAFVDRTWSDTAAALDAAEARSRVQRVGPSLFLIAVEASVPSARAPIAQRRMRVLFERPASLDTSIVPAPRPIARWASADLY